jgi:hypothetical protein
MVKHARMIEPLRILSRSLADLAGGSTAVTVLQDAEQTQALREETVWGGPTSHSHNTPEPDESEYALQAHGSVGARHHAGSHRQSPSNRSSGSHEARTNSPFSSRLSADSSSIVSAGEGKLSRLGRILSWPAPSNKTPVDTVTRAATLEIQREPEFRSYCFSSDGKSLLLWKRNGDRVCCSVIPRAGSDGGWDWAHYRVPGVVFVAGGGVTVATISKVRSLPQNLKQSKLPS